MRPLLPLLIAIASACGVGDEGVPPGKVAVVGEVVLGPEDLAGIKAQLGAYAQLRFSGEEGQAGLLQAVVMAELLAQEAVDHGLGDHPVVRFALIEEAAAVYLAAELERRVPRADVAADTAALREYYDAHPADFTLPERRNVEGVVFTKLPEAEEALAQLRLGTAALADYGQVISTPLQAREDVAHPGFHKFLFAEGMRPGDWLEVPALIGSTMLCGRVKEVVPAAIEPFDDPGVQERLVSAVRAPRAAAAKATLMAELSQRFPEAKP